MPEADAHNFSLVSENASAVTLLLYSPDDLIKPVLEVPLDPLVNKLRSIWFCRVPRAAVPTARYYAYRVDGPAEGSPEGGHAFDPGKVLLDPWAKAVHFPPGFDRQAAIDPGPNAGKAPLGVLDERPPTPDAVGRRHSRHGSDALIYEMHLRGFTKSPTSGVPESKRGTFAGVIEKIPYLKELGVTMVELMPVQQFDPQEGNYWGYMTLNFFSPHQQYAARPDQAREEFRAMVDAFHEAGIEVILDVVYNHTTEGDHSGPKYSFKGIDNRVYYMLANGNGGPYKNYSGTGNTLHCAHRAVRTMVIESLRYWVTEFGVDGFRFDLASIFTRTSTGEVEWSDSPLVTAIRADPVLRGVHLIAEPWDAAGLYQLGAHFPGQLWHQWNGMFRDDVRRFVRGDPGMVPPLMRRLYGSDDVFPDSLREACRPFQSINYIVSHDGFTLYDLVSYNERHNLANGNNNTDGTPDNHSWNCGWEGDEGVPAEVVALRKRQAKNLCCLLLLANGIPMLSAGDEFLHTQFGNNNPYNQDNETTWLNWCRLNEHGDIFRFFKRMIAFRKAHHSICRSRFWRDDVRWYGAAGEVDYSHESRHLAYCLHGESVGDEDLYVMINARWEPLRFTIQEWGGRQWKRVVDTSRPSPDDIAEPGAEAPVSAPAYSVQPRSVVVLVR
jgi:glycogen operon protein